MKAFARISIFILLMIGIGAHAQNNPITDKCFPVQEALDRNKTASLKKNQRDTVNSFLEAHFVGVEKRSLPMKLYLKYDGMRDEFIVSESGEVEDFHVKVFGAPNEALICGTLQDNGKIGIIMSSSVRFKNRSGEHTIVEILDGVKDGKLHYQKNVGGAKALFVPKMTHIAIVYDAHEADPNVAAMANGQKFPIEPESYGDMWVIDVDVLEGSQIEMVAIGGGAYNLFPVPSIKKMKSLGIK